MVDFLHHLPDELAVALLRTMGSLSQRHVVTFEPILEQTNAVGRWITKNDRGDFMRPREHLIQLYKDGGAGCDPGPRSSARPNPHVGRARAKPRGRSIPGSVPRGVRTTEIQQLARWIEFER